MNEKSPTKCETFTIYFPPRDLEGVVDLDGVDDLVDLPGLVDLEGVDGLDGLGVTVLVGLGAGGGGEYVLLSFVRVCGRGVGLGFGFGAGGRGVYFLSLFTSGFLIGSLLLPPPMFGLYGRAVRVFPDPPEPPPDEPPSIKSFLGFNGFGVKGGRGRVGFPELFTTFFTGFLRKTIPSSFTFGSGLEIGFQSTSLFP